MLRSGLLPYILHTCPKLCTTSRRHVLRAPPLSPSKVHVRSSRPSRHVTSRHNVSHTMHDEASPWKVTGRHVTSRHNVSHTMHHKAPGRHVTSGRQAVTSRQDVRRPQSGPCSMALPEDLDNSPLDPESPGDAVSRDISGDT